MRKSTNMNSLKQILCAGAGCLTAAALTANAAPLQRSDVAAGASWVVHADCDGLRPTAIGQFIQGQLEQPGPANKLAAFQAIFGFDPRTQLHSLTLYGTGTNGVLLVYADFDAERLGNLAKGAEDYQSTSYHQHVIASWIDEKNKRKHSGAVRTYGAIQGKRVIFGQRETLVARALDVLDGSAPNLSSSESFSQLGATNDTSIIEGAARELQLPDEGPQAQILKMSRLVVLQIGEQQQKIVGTLTLEAKDEATATQIAAIGQGLLALGKLQQQNPEAGKLAQALQIHQDGATVTASLALPENDVVDALKADAARKAAKRERENAEDNK
jgi:hypothetical protein